MSSIFDLFGEDVLEEGAPSSPEGFDKVLDDVIKNRPVAGRPTGYDPSRDGGASAPAADGEILGAEGGTSGEPVSVPPAAPAPVPPAAQIPPASAEPVTPPASAGPFDNLTEMERLELAQLRQALTDPERALAVRRAMLGVEAPPVAPAVAPPVAAAAPAAPALPEEIDPGSFEAQLWHQNQAMMAELAALKAGQEAGAQQSEQQIMQQAARTASSAFSARYAGRLTAAEIEAICQHAGLQKLPEAFRPVSGSWEEAMDKSLEFTLRSNDALFSRVFGGAPPPPAAAPGTRTPEADTRGRKLTALSSAASPSGEAAQRVPLEHRGDGKLTEKSRMALVQELINGDGSLRSTE